ncbi:BRCT domain-containing protein, partial [Enterococcus faecalis]|uniref:BRCT domain-containing protein n=2 Tax=Enterococcus TaxID=1350 RepID=UPI003CC60D3B
MRNVSSKNKTVVFTGTLQTLTREQAQRLVYSLHGHCQSSVTKQTDMLVCGHYTKSLLNSQSIQSKN